MRSKGAWSETTYASRVAEVQSVGRGTATYEGEARVRQGKGLDPLVDPKGLPKYGPVRQSNNLLIPDGKTFVLPYGIAMPVETNSDTTASMGRNVDIFFRVQPKVQNLLIQGKNAVLRRYQAQMCTGSIGDRVNKFPYQRTQFEPDNEVERQMGLLAPERNGGITTTEEYQLALFAGAYLTKATITQYGLRGYYFIVGDEIGYDTFDESLLVRIFGEDVFEKAFGYKPQILPGTKDAVYKLMQEKHCFYLQVYNHSYTKRWWTSLIGAERIIEMPRTENLAEIQAVLIGLTEGTLDLQNAVDFLQESNVGATEAKRIVEACAKIPIGLQTTFPNFGKIPLAGAKFANREDIWPIDEKATKSRKKRGMSSAKKEDELASWQV